MNYQKFPPGRITAFYGLSWPLMTGFFACMGLLTLTSWQTLVDPDTYMHLTVGQWILSHHAIPRQDFFSHSLPGASWMAHEWLSEAILALIYDYLGWTGLVFVLSLFLAITLAILLRFLLARVPPIYGIFFTALTYTALANHLLVRPHILVWPILIIWVTSLVNAGERHKPPSLYLLPFMCLWANLHGSFVFGLAITLPLAAEAIYSYGAKEGRALLVKKWMLFWCLAIAASLLTPLGISGLLFPFELFKLKNLGAITEWMPYQFTGLGGLEIALLSYLLLAVLGLFKVSFIRGLILVGLLHQALTHNRYVSIFGLVAPILLAESFGKNYALWQTARPSKLDQFFDRFVQTSKFWADCGVAAVLVIVALLMGSAHRHAPSTLVYPVAAVEFAKQAGVTGNVLNSYDFGGYLISQGIPVFIDGRADLYDEKILGLYLDAVRDGDKNSLDSLIKNFDIQWVLIRPDIPSVQYFESNPRWKMLYQDKTAMLFVPTNFVAKIKQGG